MEVVLIILVAQGLNLAGALVAKYLAMNLGMNWLAFGLMLLLVLCFGTRLVFWFLVGRRWQLSFIYPFLSVNYALAMVLGCAVFGEAIQSQRIVGTALVMLGVVVLSGSGHRRELA